jgi:phage minor structural protein
VGVNVEIIVFDRNEKRIADLNPESVSNPLIIEDKEGVMNFQFSYSTKEEDVNSLQGGYYVAFLDNLEGIWKAYEIVSKVENDTFVSVQCDHRFNELATEEYVTWNTNADSALIAMTHTLAKTRWKVGTVENTRSLKREVFEKNPLEALRFIEREWGGVLRFRVELSGSGRFEFFVDLLERRGAFKGHRFEFGHNLNDFEHEVEFRLIKTALYGRGKGEEIENSEDTKALTFADITWSVAAGDPLDKPLGQDWIGSEEKRLEYGKPDGMGGKEHLFGRYDSQAETPEGLLWETYFKLVEAYDPIVNVRASVIDLEGLSEDFRHEQARLGDESYLIAEYDGRRIDLLAEIIRTERNPDDLTETVVELGNYLPVQSKRLRQIERDINLQQARAGIYERAGSLNPDGTVPTSIIRGIIDTVQNEVHSSAGFVYTVPEGILILNDDRDAGNPTEAMLLSGGKFFLANSKNADGSWKYRTFGDGGGFIADELISGSIKTDLVEIFGNANFKWNGDNIYILDPANTLKQIRIGKYDGTNYGIGFTQDGGKTWNTAMSFDGLKLSYTKVEGLSAQLSTINQNVSTAQNTADNAKTAAGNAQSTANTANTAAGNAQTTATNAANAAAAAQEDADAAATAASNAASAASAAQTAANSANSKLADLASDNKLTPVEKQSLMTEWTNIVNEKPIVDAQATTFGITTQKTAYGTSYTNLSNYITPLLSDLEATSTIVGTTLRATFKDYYDKRQLLLKAVTDAANTKASNAATAAANAQSTANAAKTAAENAQKHSEGVETALANTTVGVRNFVRYSGNFKLNDDGAVQGWSVNGAAGTSIELVEKDGGTVIHALGSIRGTSVKGFLKPNTTYRLSTEIMFATAMTVDANVPTHLQIGTSANMQSAKASIVLKSGANLAANTWNRIVVEVKTNETANAETIFIPFIYGGAVITPTTEYWLRNMKFEEGNKESSWTPAVEDVEEEVTILSTKVFNVEQAITPEGITQTVMESETFTSTMNGKADADSLGNYTSLEQLAEAKQELSGEIDEKINNIDFEPYATKTELEQESEAITAKITAGGGVNIVKNSVGFAGFDFWDTVSGSIEARQGSELTDLGYGSGFFADIGKSGWVQQKVNVVSGRIYTLSFLMRKTVDNPANAWAGMDVYDENMGKIAFVGLNSGQGVTDGFEKYTFSFVAPSDEIHVRVVVATNAVATITAVMLNDGEIALNWTLATGELYNTNVRTDLNGIRVARVDANGAVVGYTQITPDEFAGYFVNADGVSERVFYLREDETVSKKFRAQDEINMGTIKVVKVNNALHENLVPFTDFSGSSAQWGVWGQSANATKVTQVPLVGGETLPMKNIESVVGVANGTAFGNVSSSTAKFQMEADRYYTLSFLAAAHPNAYDDFRYTYIICDTMSNYRITVPKITAFPVYGKFSSGFGLTVYEVKVTFKALYTDTCRLLIGSLTTADFTGSNSFGLLYVSRVKLERGVQATEWRPKLSDNNETEVAGWAFVPKIEREEGF